MRKSKSKLQKRSVADVGIENSEEAAFRKNIFKKAGNRKKINNEILKETKQKTRFANAKLPNSSKLLNYDPEKKSLYAIERDLPTTGLLDKFNICASSGQGYGLGFNQFGQFMFGQQGMNFSFNGLNTDYGNIPAGESLNSFGAAGFGVGLGTGEGLGFGTGLNTDFGNTQGGIEIGNIQYVGNTVDTSGGNQGLGSGIGTGEGFGFGSGLNTEIGAMQGGMGFAEFQNFNPGGVFDNLVIGSGLNSSSFNTSLNSGNFNDLNASFGGTSGNMSPIGHSPSAEFNSSFDNGVSSPIGSPIGDIGNGFDFPSPQSQNDGFSSGRLKRFDNFLRH
ncbi:hypothetical protein TVAG_357120 [Trichomonas vaginalis G3]|uniref:Uncharacterized protein n=1 Tax=Trichomonas vaginalis (strain ATCC PRA-98 / G3) TaxID=412133 RepID=A2FWC4_TRIV3|nr:hypothetical protein TVAGG3_0668710 [Trichomonas vaginalis G3]EAX90788.1 hypothetical protein TVAG_357120 [Trichomonas vaginalis G3]KAI5507033.1 hypothetical protein TVAGG3_0668710 [Trichomonas vaginalis G3]|eukprot:XP_001303718.1 hypothetical protein [Trichomonas vaginalis G3]